MVQPVKIIGPSGKIIVNPEADQDFKNKLEGKSIAKLKDMLEDDDLKPEERRAILAKIAELYRENGDLTKEQKEKVDKLLAKLARGEELTDGEKEDLAYYLGVDEKELDKSKGGQTIIEGPSGKIVVNADGTSESTQKKA